MDEKSFLKPDRALQIPIDNYWLENEDGEYQEYVQDPYTVPPNDDRIWVVELLNRVQPKVDETKGDANEFHAVLDRQRGTVEKRNFPFTRKSYSSSPFPEGWGRSDDVEARKVAKAEESGSFLHLGKQRKVKLGNSRLHREYQDGKYDDANNKKDMLPASEDIYLDEMSPEDFKFYLKKINTMKADEKEEFFRARAEMIPEIEAMDLEERVDFFREQLEELRDVRSTTKRKRRRHKGGRTKHRKS
jgi:hypothetical protein